MTLKLFNLKPNSLTILGVSGTILACGFSSVLQEINETNRNKIIKFFNGLSVLCFGLLKLNAKIQFNYQK